MTAFAQTEEKVWIPKISDERLAELAERIKPVVRFASGEDGPFKSSRGFLHFIAPVDLRKTAYTWGPKAANRAEGLEEVRDIRMYHSYGAPMFFKPSIAEVIAAIPDELLDEVVAFEIIGSPDTADELNAEHEALNAGYHVALTRLYRKT